VNGCDPRTALYKTRFALKDSFHDWASVIAYARFPENINEQLLSTELQMLFDTMKTTAAWVDHVFRFIDKITPDKKEGIFNMLRQKLDNSIEKLSDRLEKSDKKVSTLNGVDAAEHLGLLGSAYKRKAEYLYHLVQLQPENKEGLLTGSLEALKTAKDFYYAGFDASPVSHWNAMQYLSLKAVLDGIIENDIWVVVKFMAEKDEKKAIKESDKVWSWGTLAELYMLQPFLSAGSSDEKGSASLVMSKNYIAMINSKSNDFNQQKESMARQLERYIYWFPQLIASDNVKQLKESAGELRALLPPIEELI
jgi:hypothetical protein